MKNIKIDTKTIKEGLEKKVSNLAEYCLSNTLIKDIEQNNLQDKYSLVLEENMSIEYRLAIKESVIYPLKIEDITNQKCENKSFWFDQGVGVEPCIEVKIDNFEEELKEEIKYKIIIIENWFKQVVSFHKQIMNLDSVTILPVDVQLEIQDFYNNLEKHIDTQEKYLNKLKSKLSHLC